MAHAHPVELDEPLLHGVDRVAIEVGCPLLELGEVLDRPEAALRAVDLLVEHPAQAGRVEAEPALLGAVVGVEVELAGGVAVDVAVEAGHAEARVALLRSSVGLNSSCGKGVSRIRRPSSWTGVRMSLNSAMEVVDRDDLAAGDVAQLGPVLEEDGRRELGEERLGQVELDVEPLEPREHRDLHLREDLPAGRVLRVRQGRIGERPALRICSGVIAASLSQSCPRPVGPSGRRPGACRATSWPPGRAWARGRTGSPAASAGRP